MYDNWAEDLKKDNETVETEAIAQLRDNMWSGDFLLTASKEDVAQFQTPILLFMGDDLYHPQGISREIAHLAPNVTLVEKWKNSEILDRTNETIHSFLIEHSH